MRFDWLRSEKRKANKELEKETYRKLRNVLDGSHRKEIFPQAYILDHDECDYCGVDITLTCVNDPKSAWVIYTDNEAEVYLNYKRFVELGLNLHKGEVINPNEGKDVLIARLREGQKINTIGDGKNFQLEGYLIKEKGSFWSGYPYVSRILDSEQKEYANVEYPAWHEKAGIWRTYYTWEEERETSLGMPLGVIFHLIGKNDNLATGYYMRIEKMLIELNSDDFNFFDFVCALYTGSQLMCKNGIYTPNNNVFIRS